MPLLIFPVLIITSLPAVSILYGNDFLFRHGLTCVINPIPTNNTLLHIKLYNNKLIPSTFEKSHYNLCVILYWLNIRKIFQMLAENSLNNHFLPFANICTVASFLASYESYTKKKEKKRRE